MLVTLFGISMLVSLLQYANAEEPMLVSLLFSANFTLVRLVHQENAEDPMLVTLFGISMLVRLVQPENAEEPILVSLLFSANFTLVRLEQSSNAQEPIVSTPLGIVKLVAVLPIAYCINVLPSFVYKFPSTDLYDVLSASTVMLVRLEQSSNA